MICLFTRLALFASIYLIIYTLKYTREYGNVCPAATHMAHQNRPLVPVLAHMIISMVRVGTHPEVIVGAKTVLYLQIKSHAVIWGNAICHHDQKGIVIATPIPPFCRLNNMVSTPA